jgi:hypothetical protein
MKAKARLHSVHFSGEDMWAEHNSNVLPGWSHCSLGFPAFWDHWQTQVAGPGVLTAGHCVNLGATLWNKDFTGGRVATVTHRIFDRFDIAYAQLDEIVSLPRETGGSITKHQATLSQ